MLADVAGPDDAALAAWLASLDGTLDDPGVRQVAADLELAARHGIDARLTLSGCSSTPPRSGPRSARKRPTNPRLLVADQPALASSATPASE